MMRAHPDPGQDRFLTAIVEVVKYYVTQLMQIGSDWSTMDLFSLGSALIIEGMKPVSGHHIVSMLSLIALLRERGQG